MTVVRSAGGGEGDGGRGLGGHIEMGPACLHMTDDNRSRAPDACVWQMVVAREMPRARSSHTAGRSVVDFAARFWG
jgi:hypothetical protein